MMQTYLAVFTTFHRDGEGVQSLAFEVDGQPTITTVRELEAIIKDRVDARTAVLTNLIPLAGGVNG